MNRNNNNSNNNKKEKKASVFFETIASVRRVVTVVQGGRIFSFSVLAIIGNKKGVYGIGQGKALDITSAKRKAVSAARKNLVKVGLRSGRTVHHSVNGKFGATQVVIRPAAPGTGIVAGGAVRSLLESIGVQDVVTKIIGSSNTHTVLLAATDALAKTHSLRTIAQLRSKSVKDLLANISQKNSEEEYSEKEEEVSA
jgi:small subunit ribosomal protein S5